MTFLLELIQDLNQRWFKGLAEKYWKWFKRTETASGIRREWLKDGYYGAYAAFSFLGPNVIATPDNAATTAAATRTAHPVAIIKGKQIGQTNLIAIQKRLFDSNAE